MRLNANNTAALFIDLQEKLVPAMSEPVRLIQRTSLFLKGLAIYQIPLVVTRQYPKGLGDTVSPIRDFLTSFPSKVVSCDKLSFSCLDEPAISSFFDQPEIHNVFLCGIESHICVLQTGLDLLQIGKRVYYVADCIDSRNSYEIDIAEKRMIQAGIVPATAESLLFELTRKAGSEQFRQISKLVTER